MPVPHSITAPSDNQPLSEFVRLKARYGGPLNAAHLPQIKRELADIVPNGRYIGRDGQSPVCVVARDLDAIGSGFSHVVVVFIPVNKREEKRDTVEKFLNTYKFFASDCA